MDQKGYVHLEMEKDEHKFTFVMPMGASLADAADVSFKMFKACDKMYRDAIDKEVKEKEEAESGKVEIKTDTDS